MPTYLYETVPSTAEASPEQFEVRQGFNEPPLQAHPTSGVPVRRVISGGFGVMSKGAGAAPSQAPGQGCGPGACGCGRF